MKPGQFEYYLANTLQEALSYQEQLGEDAKILAGGQSLVPMLNFRLASPQFLIDINNISELRGIEQSSGSLDIGPLTRHREIEFSPVVQQHCPILVEAARWIGHPQIRNRGTIGGSMCHADPTGEFPTCAVALEAEFTILDSKGNRSKISADDFFVSYLTTALEPKQMLVNITVPTIKKNTGWAFLEVNDGDGGNAIVNVAVLVIVGADGNLNMVRIALGGMGATPVRVHQAERLLTERPISNTLLEEAAKLVASAGEPETDIHASAEYKRQTASALVQRALQQALERARG